VPNTAPPAWTPPPQQRLDVIMYILITIYGLWQMRRRILLDFFT